MEITFLGEDHLLKFGSVCKPPSQLQGWRDFTKSFAGFPLGLWILRGFSFSFFLSCCGISEEEEEALWSLELLLKVGWLDLFGFGWELLCLGWCGCLFMGDQERVLAQLIKIW